MTVTTFVDDYGTEHDYLHSEREPQIIYENKTGKLANHWGIFVDSEIPTTGVAQNNHVEWLHDEIYDGIDLDFEEHCKECPNEDHDLCWESNGSETVLIGSWKKDDQGLYEPDKDGEYSAICGEIYTQVVWSKHTKRCALCSPCYPGQGDLDSSGEFLCYDLPPDLYGEDDLDSFVEDRVIPSDPLDNEMADYK